MRLFEIDFIGGRSPKFDELRRKYKMSYMDLIQQLAKGIRVETEHTKDLALAREIALDHLGEYPDYYDRLEKMEQN